MLSFKFYPFFSFLDAGGGVDRKGEHQYISWKCITIQRALSAKGNLKDVNLKMTPSKFFNIKIFMKLTFLVLKTKVFPGALFHSDIK